MIHTRQISSSERRCPTTKMLASSVPTSSLTMIIVRNRQRTPSHVARGGCACICVPTHVGEYVSEILAWRVVALAPHQPFGAMLPKNQHVGVQLFNRSAHSAGLTSRREINRPQVFEPAVGDLPARSCIRPRAV